MTQTEDIKMVVTNNRHETPTSRLKSSDQLIWLVLWSAIMIKLFSLIKKEKKLILFQRNLV